MSIPQNLFTKDFPPPCVRVEFRLLPSWNDVLAGVEAFKLRAIVKLWRGRGRERAVETMRRRSGVKIVTVMRATRQKDKRTGEYKKEFFEGLDAPYFIEPVGCVVRLWRPSGGEYDIHNLVIKPICGFNVFER